MAMAGTGLLPPSEQALMPACLPGFTLADDRTHFARRQQFATIRGVRYEMDKEQEEKPKMVHVPVSGHQTLGPGGNGLSTAQSTHKAFRVKDADELPAWDALDRHVLRFYGFFQEAVAECNLENFRVRKCILFYYLEDDTMHVTEPRTDNSGLPQGTLIRRHRVPLPDGGYVTPKDLRVGEDFTIYSRTIRIVDCDAFTRGYFEQQGLPQLDAQPVPVDSFVQSQQDAKGKASALPRSYEKNYREMLLGGGHINRDMQQFMENDRKVLRFFAVMDDLLTAQYERRPFVVLYFLADDTMQIREQYPLNCGRDNFPIFFKKGKMAKGSVELKGPMIPLKDDQYWNAEDLYVGLQANFCGNQFFIYDCDEFTRDYYSKALNVDLQGRIDVRLQEQEVPRPPTPPYTGYGSWDDSMASVLNLIPKVPRRDFHKLMYNDKKVLRFTAKFDSPKEEDINRRFVISYYLWDDGLSIHEPPQRNSGILSGKFLEKGAHLNQETGRLFEPDNLLPGNVIRVCNHAFRMLDMDERTRKILEHGGDDGVGPQLVAVLAKLQEAMRQQFPLVRDTFRRFDRDHNGVVTLEEMKEALQKFAFHLTEDEVLMVMKHFDTRKDGQVSYNEFCDAVLERDYHTSMLPPAEPLQMSVDEAYKARSKEKTLMRTETEKVRRAAQELSKAVYQSSKLPKKLIKEFGTMTHQQTVTVEMVHAVFLRLGFHFDIDDVERAIGFFMPNSPKDRIRYFDLVQALVAGHHDLAAVR